MRGRLFVPLVLTAGVTLLLLGIAYFMVSAV